MRQIQGLYDAENAATEHSKAEKFHFHGHNVPSEWTMEQMRAALCACGLMWRGQMPTTCVWDVPGSGGLGSTIR